ncbi:hypothetical protein B9Z45_14940 [Limnohabitans sp. 2KL-17]|nr:hypothetical protein B9Z45_14940 [Limnohabitans sp. 2KL-17]
MGVDRWKIQRELRRLGAQLLEPYRQIRDAFLRMDYQMRRVHYVKHFAGDAPWTPRVAVFLIYQPHGVADSVIATCGYLKQQGYACVLVSNGALMEKDRDRLSFDVAHLIVRPNFGYDFGGYQEAVLWLQQSGTQPEHLLLINDSVWFPAVRNSTFLSDMEKTGADVVGALSAQRGRSQSHQRQLFYASFMLLFSEKVWRSSEFRNFWLSYRQTSSKPRTIRRGERKLSALFIHDERFTQHAMVDQQTYEGLAGNKSEFSWPLFAQELVVMDRSLAQERNALLQCADADVVVRWREWYGRLCDSQNMFACAQMPLVLRLGVPFIKKSKDHHNMLVLQRIVDALGASDELEPLVVQEIQSHVYSYFHHARFEKR